MRHPAPEGPSGIPRALPCVHATWIGCSSPECTLTTLGRWRGSRKGSLLMAPVQVGEG